MGTDSSGDIAFMEVRDDGLVIRSIDGLAADRVYYDNLINMTFSPKTKVLCLWHRQDKADVQEQTAVSNAPIPNTAATKLNQYHCKKVRPSSDPVVKTLPGFLEVSPEYLDFFPLGGVSGGVIFCFVLSSIPAASASKG